ncbi:hypothetical protein TNCV_3567951 [Trichonephila clavipes]|nr:hypothetical protein TNCV_3567951 [Trichonephila clavipes]
MVFQERMLYSEPTEARLEEILQSGKEYLPRAMHMTDQNSVLSSTPRGDQQPCFPTHTILLDPLLGAEWFNSVVFHSPSKVPFCLSLEPIKSHFLLLSSIKTGLESQSPHRHGGRSRFQVYLIQYQGVHLSDYITFMTQFRIIVNGLQPPEIIDLHTDTEQRIGELLTKVLPDHHSLDILRVRVFARFEPKDVSSDYVEQEASKGKGAFIQALWTLYARSSLYRLAYKAWKRNGPQNLTTWTLSAQAVLDGCYAEKWPDTVFQVPDVCSICLSPMPWPEKTHCGHGFHLQCLLQHLDVSNTCPLCRAPNPLRTF